jgi:hypothetical protein
VNEADEAEQRRLERHPEPGHASAVLAAARLASDGEHLANGVRVAHAWPVVGPRMATAAAAMPFATCVALAPGAHTSAAVARMPSAHRGSSTLHGISLHDIDKFTHDTGSGTR